MVAEVELYQKRAQGMDKEFADLQKKLTDSEQLIEDLTHHLHIEKSENARLRTEQAAVKKQADRLAKERKASSKNLQSKIELINKLEASNLSIRRQLADSVKERSGLELELRERDEDGQELVARRKENRDLTKQINVLNKDITGLQLEIGNLKDELDSKLRKKRATVFKPIDQEPTPKLQADIVKLEKQVVREVAQKKKAKQQLKDEKMTITKLRTRIKTKNLEIKELKIKCSSYWNKNLTIEREWKARTLNIGNSQISVSNSKIRYDHDSYINLIHQQLSSRIENDLPDRKIIKARRKL